MKSLPAEDLFKFYTYLKPTTMDYKKEKDRIYAVGASGKILAEVTFPTVGNVSTIDHTFVDPSLRGQGVASQLVKLAADEILASGKKIAATCPYAITWFKRHPEYNLVCEGPVACKLSGSNQIDSASDSGQH